MSLNRHEPASPDSDRSDLPPVEVSFKCEILPDDDIITVSVSDKARVSVVSEVTVSPKLSTGNAVNQTGESYRVSEVQENHEDRPGPSFAGTLSKQALYDAATKSPSYLTKEELQQISKQSKDEEDIVAKGLDSHTSISEISLESTGSPWSPRKAEEPTARPSASNLSHESQGSDWPPGDKANPFRGKVSPVAVYEEDIIDLKTELQNQNSQDSVALPGDKKGPSRGKVHPVDNSVDDFKDQESIKTGNKSHENHDSDWLPGDKENPFRGKVPLVATGEEDLKKLETGNKDNLTQPLDKSNKGELGSIPGTPQPNISREDTDNDPRSHDKTKTSEGQKRPVPAPRRASIDRKSKLAGKATASVRSQGRPKPRERLPSIVVLDTITGNRQTEFDPKRKMRQLHLPGLVRARQRVKEFKKKLPKLASLPARMASGMNKLRGVHAMKMTSKMRAISLDVPQPTRENRQCGGLSALTLAHQRRQKVAEANAEWAKQEGPPTPEKASDKVQFSDRSDLRLFWEKPTSIWKRIRSFSFFKKCSTTLDEEEDEGEILKVDYVVDTDDVC